MDGSRFAGRDLIIEIVGDETGILADLAAEFAKRLFGFGCAILVFSQLKLPIDQVGRFSPRQYGCYANRIQPPFCFELCGRIQYETSDRINYVRSRFRMEQNRVSIQLVRGGPMLQSDRSLSPNIALTASTALCFALAFASQAFANPAMSLVERQQAAPVTIGSNPYDHSLRTASIGGGPAEHSDSDGAPIVTFSRAADLVGRPLAMLRPSRPALHASFGSAPFGAFAPSSGALPSSMPVASSFMTSGFGMREHPLLGGWRAHTGIDLAAPIGSPIRATADGLVSRADWFGGYGLFVSLEHGGGVQTRYGHMARMNVQEGQHVRKGDVIGYVGSTGRSTGPHLHYEI